MFRPIGGPKDLPDTLFHAELWEHHASRGLPVVTTAKAEVASLIERIGFVGIDLGSLAVGGKLAQFPGGPLPNQNLVKIG